MRPQECSGIQTFRKIRFYFKSACYVQERSNLKLNQKQIALTIVKEGMGVAYAVELETHYS